MNILVTGANGQLGNEMRRVSARSSDHYIFTDVAELDITDLAAIQRITINNQVDVIVNCAAYTNVDKAEEDEATANLINNLAVKYLAIAAKEIDATLIHISTDYVFQGDKNTPCQEEWDTNPLGIYGKTKLERDTLKVVFDQVGTPTYAGDLAALIVKIINENQLTKQGIYHFSNEGICSWYDFAKEIAALSNHTCDIQPCHSNEFPSKVKRPHFSVLDKSKVKETFNITIPHWKDSLIKCINELEA